MSNVMKTLGQLYEANNQQIAPIKIKSAGVVEDYGKKLEQDFVNAKTTLANSMAHYTKSKTNKMNSLAGNVVNDGVNGGYTPTNSKGYDYVSKIESGGSYTAKNPNSSAYGKYQHLDATRSALAKQMNVSVGYLRTPNGQEAGQQHLVNEQRSQLKGLGLPDSADNMLAIHQMGYPDFKKWKAGTLSTADKSKLNHLYSYK